MAVFVAAARCWEQSLFGSRGLFPRSARREINDHTWRTIGLRNRRRRSRGKFQRGRRKRWKDRRSGGRVGQRARQGEKDTLCPLMTPGIRLVSDIEKITRHGMKGRPRLSAAVEHEDDTG